MFKDGNGYSDPRVPAKITRNGYGLDDDADFDKYVIENCNSSNYKSELYHYLEESLLLRTKCEFDILNWWKTNGAKYPTLQMIAMDLLAIPISTVASLSSFSTSGRFLTPHHSRLHSHTLEALMCLQDWLWSDVRGSSKSIENINFITNTILEDIDDDDVMKFWGLLGDSRLSERASPKREAQYMLQRFPRILAWARCGSLEREKARLSETWLAWARESVLTLKDPRLSENPSFERESLVRARIPRLSESVRSEILKRRDFLA
ncbi:hypothetical protein Lal_00042522 [Lupinus albus]|nr:hypothetical protein Lal_00042522 [Lupinus albus]